jgi:hypothetical protein
LSWEEWEYFKNFGDVQRVKNVFFPLLGYHRWYAPPQGPHIT